MAKASLTGQQREKGNNILSALISNVGIIIQIASVSLVGLSDAFGVTKIFVDTDLLNISNFFIFITTFSMIGTYTFIKNNKNLFSVDFGKDQARGDKRLSMLLSFLTTAFFLLFLISTYQILRKPFIWDSNIVGLFQALSYSGILIAGTLSVFIWIKDEFSKQKQFDPDDFVPNIKDALRDYGHLKEPDIQISENIILGDMNRLITYRINSLDNAQVSWDGDIKNSVGKTVISTYDGRVIIRVLTQVERKDFIDSISQR